MESADIRVETMPGTGDLTVPVVGAVEETMQRVRQRAFDLFAARGSGDGHALDDWLAAEREICWPAGELVERDEDFVLELALAGFAPREVSVAASPREVVVHAQTKKQRAKDGEVRWSEFRENDVYRCVEFGSDIDPGKVAARFRNGMLEVVVPKARPPAAARQVPVATRA